MRLYSEKTSMITVLDRKKPHHYAFCPVKGYVCRTNKKCSWQNMELRFSTTGNRAVPFAWRGGRGRGTRGGRGTAGRGWGGGGGRARGG